jgi:putative ABC transport system permease protein
MIVRFVRDSIRRSPRRKALIVAAIALGTSVATAMLGVMLSIGDKINVELREAGANIVVTSRAAALTGGVGGVTAAVSGDAGDIQESLNTGFPVRPMALPKPPAFAPSTPPGKWRRVTGPLTTRMNA